MVLEISVKSNFDEFMIGLDNVIEGSFRGRKCPSESEVRPDYTR